MQQVGVFCRHYYAAEQAETNHGARAAAPAATPAEAPSPTPAPEPAPARATQPSTAPSGTWQFIVPSRSDWEHPGHCTMTPYTVHC